jgi:cell shape-determining protein MreC
MIIAYIAIFVFVCFGAVAAVIIRNLEKEANTHLANYKKVHDQYNKLAEKYNVLAKENDYLRKELKVRQYNRR